MNVWLIERAYVGATNVIWPFTFTGEVRVNGEVNGSCEEEMEVCGNVPQRVTKSLASDVMSDKSIDISENSLSDNASNCSKDFNNAENFSVDEGEDLKVPNSKSLSESGMCKDLGTEVPREDEEEDEEEEGEEGDDDDEADDDGDDDNEDEMKDSIDENADKNDDTEAEESGLGDNETEGGVSDEEAMDTDIIKDIPCPSDNHVRSRKSSLGSDAESCGDDDGDHDMSEDSKDELLASREKDKDSCNLDSKALDDEYKENVSDDSKRSETANHVDSCKETAVSAKKGDSSKREFLRSEIEGDVSKKVSDGSKEDLNQGNTPHLDIEEISNDSIKSSKSVKSPRNENSEGNIEAAEKEGEKKDGDADASDSKSGDTSAKVKKSRKSAPVLNVTPRRSSRNLCKAQKSYVEKEEDPDIEEITPEDPLADPLSADPFRDDKENTKTRNTRKTTIVVNDTKRLVEIAAGTKGMKGGKKEPTLVIIDTNSILSGRGPIPVSQGPPHSSKASPAHTGTSSVSAPSSSSSGYSVLPVAVPAQGMYPSHSSMRMSSPALHPPPPAPKPPQILPTLTDDMYVVEAPSFIVPYVYEKPPITPLKEYIEKLGKEIEEMKEKEKQEREEREGKENNEKEETEEENKGKERDAGGDKVAVAEEGESNSEDTERHSKEEDAESEEKKNSTNGGSADTKDSPDASQNKSKGEGKDECSGKNVKTKENEAVSESQVKADEGQSGEEKRDSEDLKSGGENTNKSGSETQTSASVPSEDKKDKVADPPKPEEKSNKPPTYFDNPLGKFFMQIGVNLVQEYVQTDLLRSQKRKRDRDGGKGGAVAQFAINSLLKNLELSKENNEPFHLEQKKCEYCSFKTESSLVMAQHLETPHMRNYVYRCNFCPLEVRSPHDILFHMEAEHNVRGRLERAPAFHQCPNCPFEDNQKGKLTRHLLSCAKKYKPERNQEPSDWEPPAKIPRISRNRPSSLGLGAAAYQAMAGKQVQSHHPLLPKLVPAPSLTSSGMGRGRGRPPIHARYHMPDMKVPPQRGVASPQIRQSKCICGL